MGLKNGHKIEYNSGAKINKISIENNKGKIRLRWTFEKERYQLTPGLSYSEENILLVQKLIGEIYQDMLTGSFDRTIAKYKSKKILSLNPENLVILFEDWVKNILH